MLKTMVGFILFLYTFAVYTGLWCRYQLWQARKDQKYRPKKIEKVLYVLGLIVVGAGVFYLVKDRTWLELSGD
jgi:uncharacterized membrane protein YidH (DUF202 family)